MLESLLSIKRNYTKYYEGQVLKTLPCPGKGTFASGLVGNKIMYVGGSGDNGTYPRDNPVITLSSDGLSVSSTTYASGYEGTWLFGTTLGNDLWYMVGHTGSYQKTIKKRGFSTGEVTKSFQNFPGTGRTSPVVVAVDSINILVGYGNNSLKDFYNFNTSTEQWTTLPSWSDSIKNFAGTYNKVDGNAYIGLTADDRLIRYNPVTKTYSTTSSFRHYNRNSFNYAMNNGSGLSYGKYVLIFMQNLSADRRSEFSVLRYDTILDRFSVFNLTGVPARRGGGVVMNETNKLIYFVSGAQVSTLSIDNAVKFNNMLVFEADQFLVE